MLSLPFAGSGTPNPSEVQPSIQRALDRLSGHVDRPVGARTRRKHGLGIPQPLFGHAEPLLGGIGSQHLPNLHSHHRESCLDHQGARRSCGIQMCRGARLGSPQIQAELFGFKLLSDPLRTSCARHPLLNCPIKDHPPPGNHSHSSTFINGPGWAGHRALRALEPACRSDRTSRSSPSETPDLRAAVDFLKVDAAGI